MSSDLSSVKIKAYHHGDLRRVLIETALAVLTEKGVDGFSLRETARRAGVSPGAPKHHFADTRALLTAIATDAFQELGDELERASAETGASRRKRLAGQAEAYVGFALNNPARFDLMWRSRLLDQEDAAYAAAGDRAFMMLDALVRGADAQPVARTDPLMAPTIASWSLVHGLARLALDGAMGPLDEQSREALRQMARRIVEDLSTAIP